MSKVLCVLYYFFTQAPIDKSINLWYDALKPKEGLIDELGADFNRCYVYFAYSFIKEAKRCLINVKPTNCIFLLTNHYICGIIA